MFSKILKPSDAVDDLKVILAKKYLYAGAWNDLYDKKQTEYMRFRMNLKSDLYKRQGGYCAYCECLTAERDLQIEHFAPKGSKEHPMYVEQQFNPLNLVLSCEDCNMTYKKTYDPVLKLQDDYSKWTFKIVHPYFDNPKDFFSLVPLDDGTKGFFPIIRKDVDLDNKKKAEETFSLFKFYEEKRITRIVKSFLGIIDYNPDVERTVKTTAYVIKMQLETKQETDKKSLIYDTLVYKKSF